MALADNLTEQKAVLTSLLENEYPEQNLRDSPLLRLLIIRFLLGELTGSGSGTIGTTPTRFDRISSTSSATMLASNTSRKTAAITNESTATMYILYGNTAAASSTNYTYILPATSGGISSTLFVDDYNGIITGVWASANGFARITEVV